MGFINNIDRQYQALLQDILDNGVEKKDRTGTGTISVFGRQIRHKMSEGFPLLTTKKMPWKTIVTELLWFLQGNTNIKWLVDNGCNIWNGDAFKNFMTKSEGDPDVIWNQEQFINKIKTDDEFAEKWGNLGKIYGAQWRSWGERKHDSISNEYFIGIDQIQNLINDLKTNPDSRRLMVNAWAVHNLPNMVLPPCHYGFQVYTRELSVKERLSYFEEFFDCTSDSENMNEHEIHIELSKSNIPTRAISLMFNMRSVDTFLGLPFNIASYGLLLEIIAKEVNMVPDELIGNLGDVHLYSNHIEQAKEQIGRALSLDERREMVTQEMFDQIYNAGGPETLSHSEIDQWDIPRILREPFPLPKLSYLDEYFYLNDVGFAGEIPFAEKIEKFRPDFFKMQDYQSHPAIKAPLSN